MKTAFIIILLGAVSLCFGAFSTSPATNASALGLTTANYEYSMAYAGTLSGFLFGLFLWKIR